MTNLTQFADFDLAPELLNAIQKKGYQRPTAIQQETLPAAMDGEDVLGSAPTGTGKPPRFCYRRFNICWIIRAVNRARRVC